MSGLSIIYRNILIMEQVNRLISECVRTKIDICLLKGSALIYNGTCDIRERDMEDIDVLVGERDAAQLEALLLSMGYTRVCSGEIGYYKAGYNAMIDIHTGLLYADKVRTEGIWERMHYISGVKVMEPMDHLIYIVHHALVHHGSYAGHWASDFKKLICIDMDTETLSSRLTELGLKEAFFLAFKKLQIDPPVMPDSLLRLRYMQFMLSLPEYSEKGHFLRFATVRNLSELIRFTCNFIFPGISFLRRRYRLRPAALMIYIRPLLLFIKGLYGIVFLAAK